MSKEQTTIGIILRGMAMGIAEIIPGVSGGTIAFITGIYERLIGAISGVGPKQITAFKEDKFKGLWNSVDGTFLMFLMMGMGIGVVAGTFGVSYFLENYPEPLWAFFFGLILASVFYIIRQISNFNIKYFGLFVVGAVIAYLMTSLYPMVGSESYPYLFFCGMIAICALILPGVSGSFMLLILGAYTIVIGTIRNFLSGPSIDGFMTLAVFGMGCLVGLLSFSKVVSYFFKKFHDGTLAVLAGFMIGSIHKIWPWRNPLVLFDKDAGQNITTIDYNRVGAMLQTDDYKVVLDGNVLPADYYANPNTIFVVIAFILGFLAVILLSRFDAKS